NMVFVIRDPKLALDDLGDPSTGPHIATKTISFGTVPQKLRDQTLLRIAQFRRVAGARMSEQSIGSLLLRQRQPLAHGTSVDSKRRRNIDFPPAQSVQFDRS